MWKKKRWWRRQRWLRHKKEKKNESKMFSFSLDGFHMYVVRTHKYMLSAVYNEFLSDSLCDVSVFNTMLLFSFLHEDSPHFVCQYRLQSMAERWLCCYDHSSLPIFWFKFVPLLFLSYRFSRIVFFFFFLCVASSILLELTIRLRSHVSWCLDVMYTSVRYKAPLERKRSWSRE